MDRNFFLVEDKAAKPTHTKKRGPVHDHFTPTTVACHLSNIAIGAAVTGRSDLWLSGQQIQKALAGAASSLSERKFLSKGEIR